MGTPPTPRHRLMTHVRLHLRVYSLVLPQHCYFLFIWFSSGGWSSFCGSHIPYLLLWHLPLVLGDTPQVHLGGPLPQPWNRPFLQGAWFLYGE